MAAIAHSPSFAKKAGVPQSVGKDFTQADKGKNVKKYSGTTGSLVKPGKVPKGQDPALWWSANEANAVKPGEKPYVPPKKSVPKVKKMAEGGEVSDEDTMSENAKKNIADADVAKSKAADASGKLNPDKKRGFFGSLFTGHLKDYNAQEKRKRDLNKTFGGMKSAATMDAEKKRADLDNKDKVDLSGGLQTGSTSTDSTEGSAPASKKQSFGEAFKAAKGKNFTWNGKKYSGAMKSSAPKKKTANSSRSVMFSSSNGTDSKQRFVDNMATNLAKKKDAEKVNFKPSTNKAFNYAKGGWIKDAIKKPGALRKSLKVKSGEKIPAKKLDAAAKAPGKMGQRARLAKTLGGFCGGGMTKAYKSGGLVSSRADGIASRGRTKCKIR